MPFIDFSQLPSREVFKGASGRYAHAEKMTVGEVALVGGTVIPMHSHPHDQMTMVLEGSFRFSIGSETQVITAGSIALIPGGVEHGGTVLTDCRVLDVFSPARPEYK